jgi:hypothetical protein
MASLLPTSSSEFFAIDSHKNYSTMKFKLSK